MSQVWFLLSISFAGVWQEGAPEAKASDWAHGRLLAPGVLLHQDTVESPRRNHRHIVRIDLKQPGLHLTTTARTADWKKNESETKRQTVRNFLRSERRDNRPVILAFNADAFTPWPVPFDQETISNVQGFAVCRGHLVSPPTGSPSFILKKSGDAAIRIADNTDKPDDIEVAVSGFALCLKDGMVQPSGEDLHPRTGLGLSADHRFLFVMIVDGRRHSSLGVTTAELGQWLLDVGAHDGINMDGGGSSTLAWWNPDAAGDDKAELLNRPVGNGRKLLTPEADQAEFSERANGNNVGIWFQSP
ncbi:MAG: phosphodiester glycosidase family protein [Planctomycetaceae bacterium]|nr:phosphodiester glycosidase family protein [Planctomycetaceae bacterium]